jgi:small subunit ribosomal protein S21
MAVSRGGKEGLPAAVFVDTCSCGINPGVTERTQMIKIKSRGNETAEQMLRRFKKMCEKEGLTKDIKRVAYYEKPSEKRRRRIRSKPRIKPMGR